MPPPTAPGPRQAGAEIVLDIEDVHSNGRGYSCRDLEGHVWNFGTYDPWKRQAAPAGEVERARFRDKPEGRDGWPPSPGCSPP